MRDLIIEPADNTPGVDLSHGILLFHGRCIINNTKAFFDPIFSWTKIYMKDPAAVTVLTIKLEYIDSPSLQAMFQLMGQLKELEKKGVVFMVNWYYIYGDMEMLELGQVIEERLEMEFEFNEFEPEDH